MKRSAPRLMLPLVVFVVLLGFVFGMLAWFAPGIAQAAPNVSGVETSTTAALLLRQTGTSVHNSPIPSMSIDENKIGASAAEKVIMLQPQSVNKPDTALAIDTPIPPYVNLHVTLESDTDAEYLDTIRQAVERYGWTVAFYATPEFAVRHSEAIKTLLDRGHELGVLLDMNLGGLGFEQQVERISSALTATRQAVGLPNDYRLHVRFKEYVAKYAEIKEVFRALEALHTPSLTGVFLVGDDFFCHYCAENGRLMYPLPDAQATKLVMLPVAVEASDTVSGNATSGAHPTEGQQNWIPLDDTHFKLEREILSTRAVEGPVASSLFTAASEKYKAFIGPSGSACETPNCGSAAYVHDKFMTLIVHPSVTGADQTQLSTFNRFLDDIKAKGGATTSNAQMMALTFRVLASGYIGSLSITANATAAAPGSAVNLAVTYQSTLYCPTFYFRLYGKYPSQSTWQQLHDQSSFYVNTGVHSFIKTATIPQLPEPPSESDTTYTFMVVGQSCAGGSCNWPTPTSYEKRRSSRSPSRSLQPGLWFPLLPCPQMGSPPLQYK